MAASLCGGDGRRIHLGLHQAEIPAPSMTFVKPDLLKQLDTLESLGAEFEFRRLGNDVFNEVGWTDPSGQLIRLIEARTFSPSKRRVTETSHCGYFLEIALPAPDRERSKAYWEQFGFVASTKWTTGCRISRAPATLSISVCMSPHTCAAALFDSKSMMSAEPWRGSQRLANSDRRNTLAAAAVTGRGMGCSGGRTYFVDPTSTAYAR